MSHPAKPIRVAIVDDHPPILSGVFPGLSDADPSLLPGRTAATVAELLRLEGPDRSEVVLLDVDLGHGTTPDRNAAALQAAEYVVVFYTAEYRAGDLVELLGLGARGIISKSEDQDVLAKAIRQAYAGDEDSWTPTPFMAAVYLKAESGARLTRTQRDVLERFVTGLRPAVIADQLNLSKDWVNTCIANIREAYRRSGQHDVESPTALMRAAIVAGDVPDPTRRY